MLHAVSFICCLRQSSYAVSFQGGWPKSISRAFVRLYGSAGSGGIWIQAAIFIQLVDLLYKTFAHSERVYCIIYINIPNRVATKSQCASWTLPVYCLQPWTQLCHLTHSLWLVNYTHLLLCSVIWPTSLTYFLHCLSLSLSGPYMWVFLKTVFSRRFGFPSTHKQS